MWFLHTLTTLVVAFTHSVQGTPQSTSTAPKLPRPTHYGYLLFPNFDLLDVSGPLEVLTMLSWTESPMRLSLIANKTLDPVSNDRVSDRAFNNHTWSVPVVPNYTLDTAPQDVDVLFVPGGPGTRATLETTQPYVDFIRARYPSLKYLVSVCTGAGFVARSGVLDGKNATTNKLAYDDITKLGPNVNWIRHARWVIDGNIWTTSGVSAGIDGTFAFVEAIYNASTASRIAKGMEYMRTSDPGNDPFA